MTRDPAIPSRQPKNILVLGLVARIGDRVGSWLLHQRLGKGGNGEVFRATNGPTEVALKLLHRHRWNPEGLARFRDELGSLQQCQDLPGVVRLIDSNVPTDPSDAAPPWLAMALVAPLSSEGRNLRGVVSLIRDVARTLAEMHARGLSHRDIKPSNLFSMNGRGLLGDFGLCDFEGKQAETADGEKVGPVYYIAPEMLNSATKADGRAADVYSLAKTLWVLSTGQTYPLPGHHVRTQRALTVSAYTSDPEGAKLDVIVELATAFEPTSRPRMTLIAADLDAWLEPRVVSSTSNLDMRNFAHQFVAHRERIEANSAIQRELAVDRQRIGLQLRESLRPTAQLIREKLQEAGFISIDLNIDKFMWGFSVTATIPWQDDARFVKFATQVSAETEPARTGVTLTCSHSIEEIVRGRSARQQTLWSERFDYIPDGANEGPELVHLSERLKSTLRQCVATAINLSIEPSSTP